MFLVVFALATILTCRVVFELPGWLLHIAIDIPTHSLRYYVTRFLWPVSDYRIDGMAWWTPWLWATTYGALPLLFFLLWKSRSNPPHPLRQGSSIGMGEAVRSNDPE